jgi:hypothetical protein
MKSAGQHAGIEVEIAKKNSQSVFLRNELAGDGLELPSRHGGSNGRQANDGCNGAQVG